MIVDIKPKSYIVYINEKSICDNKHGYNLDKEYYITLEAGAEDELSKDINVEFRYISIKHFR